MSKSLPRESFHFHQFIFSRAAGKSSDWLSGDLEIGVDKSFFQMHFRLPLPTSETSPWELSLTRLDKNSPFLPRLLGLCPALNKKAQLTSVVYLSVPPAVVAQGTGGGGQFRSHLPEVFAISWEEFATFIGLELTTMWFLSVAAF